MTTTFKKLVSRKAAVRMMAAVLAVAGMGSTALPVLAQETVINTEYTVIAQTDLQTVVAPIALYPDALLAQTLVASTYPQDVVAAASWLRDGGDPTFVDFRDWDSSVKGLVHYPDTLYLLADNADWMNQLGAAFLNQQADVMAAVQVVRNRARSEGVLASNSYQNVVVERQIVQIIPANPEVIYVPVYQPQIVCGPLPAFVDPGSCLSFGVGIQVGAWLHHDFDWDDHAIYVGNWGMHRPWWEHHDRDGRDGRDGDWYDRNRPGRFGDGHDGNNVTNVRDVSNIRRVTNITDPNAGSRWQRDPNRAAPKLNVHPPMQPMVTPTRGNGNPARPERPFPTAQAPTSVRPTPGVSGRPVAPVAPGIRTTPVRETAPAVPTVRPIAPTVRPTAPTARPAAPTTVRPAPAPAPVRDSTPVRPVTPGTIRPGATPAPVRDVAPARPTPVRDVARPIAPPVARPVPAPARPAPAPARQPAAPARATPSVSERPAARPLTVARPSAAPRAAAIPARPTAPVPTARPMAAPARVAAAPTVRAVPAARPAGGVGVNNNSNSNAPHGR